LNLENNLSSYEQKSISATFTAQLEELDRQSRDCCNFLKVLSFFDPEKIPLNMITEGAEDLQQQSTAALNSKSRPSLQHELGLTWCQREQRVSSADCTVDDINNTLVIFQELESLIALMSSPVQLQRAIQQLRHLSLVKYESNRDTSTLHIHDLIQFVIRESTRREDPHYNWFRVAVALACGAFGRIGNPKSPRLWARCEALNPHLQSLTIWDDGHAIGDPKLNKANLGIARYLRSHGRYGEAEVLYRRELTGAEKRVGPHHPDTLWAAGNLAGSYKLQGRYSEAETLYGQVIVGFEKLNGPKDPNTLIMIKDLANLYDLQGRYNMAEALFRQTLAGHEDVLGPEHPDTLDAMYGLAIVLWRRGQYSIAETLLGEALAVRERVLGPENPKTLKTIECLALVYKSQGRYNEAETLYERKLAANKKELGAEHPDTLRTVHNLADVYQAQGRCEEAERLYEQLLAKWERVLGPEHLDALGSVGNLGFCYNSQGRYDEAETFYERALAGNVKVLGPEHPQTQRTARNLAKLFKRQGRRDDVIILENRFPLAFKSR
jgi:tetratricopeptide (TPR) repeat protein